MRALLPLHGQLKSAGDRELPFRFQRFRKGRQLLCIGTPELDAEMHSETWTGTELLSGPQSLALSPQSYTGANLLKNALVS